MLRLILFFVFFSLHAAAQAAVYQWQDEQGVTHFSDTPVIGAKSIAAMPTQTYQNQQVVSQPKAYPSTKSSSQTSSAVSIAIKQPQNNATIFSNNGKLSVVITVDPKLNAEGKMVVWLDGKALELSNLGMEFELDAIDRGAHQLQVQLVGSNEKIIASSATVTFFMQRPHVRQKKIDTP